MNGTQIVEAYINRVGLEVAAGVFGVSQARVKQVVNGCQPTLAMFEKVMAEEKLEFTKQDAPSVGVAVVEQNEKLEVPTPDYPNWGARKIAVLTCTNRAYDHVAFGSINKLMDPKHMSLHTVYSNFGIVRGRNQLAEVFLKSGLDWSFWVDDDMILQCGDADWFRREVNLPELGNSVAGLHTIYQLLSRNKSIIGGCYFGRNIGGQPVTAAKYNNNFSYQARLGPANLVMATKWIGFGAVLIHRKVFEDIITKFPELEIKDSNVAKAYGYQYRFFDSIEETLGEDISFCRRAEQAGHQTHVDLTVMPGHVGRYVYNYKNTNPEEIL